MDHRPLGQRRDRQQRVDAQRPRNDRAVAHIEPGVHRALHGVGASVEHLALVIDDAGRAVPAHGAAAERMDRNEVVPEQGVGQRVARVVAAGRLRRLAQVAVDLLEDRLRGNFRPREFQLALIERDAALAVVMAHDEVGLRAIDRTLVGAEQEALAAARALGDEVDDAMVGVIAELVATRGQQRRQHRGERRGNRAFLDHHAVLELGCIAQIDEAGDARPHGPRLGDRRLADADAVDSHVVVVGEGQHVAVAGKALAELIGDGKPLLARAQEDLGRTERAGGEHDDVAGDRLIRGGKLLALMTERLEEHPPAPALLSDVRHAHLGEDLGAVVEGVGEVRHLHRILGADVAARAAVAAQRAGGLLDARVVHLLLERHVDRRPHHVLAQRIAADTQRIELIECRALIRHRPQHLHGAREAFLAHLVLRDLGRPNGIVPHARVWRQRDVGVDQRAAAEAAADEHVDVLAEPQIVKAGGRAGDALAVLGNLELLLRLDHAVGEVADGELLPALEHGDLLAGARHARGGNAAAISRADNDDVVAQLQLGDGLRQSPHVTLPRPAQGCAGASAQTRRGCARVPCPAVSPSAAQASPLAVAPLPHACANPDRARAGSSHARPAP